MLRCGWGSNSKSRLVGRALPRLVKPMVYMLGSGGSTLHLVGSV
jgi:hypothetical protein